MEALGAVLDRRLDQLASVRPTRVNRETWRMADDRYFHRLRRTAPLDLDVVNGYTRRREAVMSDWPGRPRSRVSWGPRRRRPRALRLLAPRLRATGWQWLGWLLSPRFPVR